MLNSKCIFVLKNDVSKGEKLTYECIQRVVVKDFNQEELVDPYESFAKIDLKKGQILNEDVISKESSSILKEKIIIPLNANIEGLNKGNFVNIYVTTNKKNISSFKIINYINFMNIYSQDITIKIINNKEILGLYKDKDNNLYVIVEADKEVALLVENIKYVARFSLSIVERGKLTSK